MIEREISPQLRELFGKYPFVTVTGPRQSGKTTLCRATFPDLTYANLEVPDQRDFAESDPRGFLRQLGQGAIIDEIQRVPRLLSYLQVLGDDIGRNSLFVLTGSEQFRLSEAITQSLAGRTSLLRLLPFSLAERQLAGASTAIDDVLYAGFYPRIIDQGLEPRQALGDYFETYVERDVRRLGGIANLSAFRRFVQLCAGRIGQLVNLSSLGSDAGVSHTTARQWLTVLEASYIVFQLQPFHANIRKRLVKSPKLYFYDVGLASYLIGIENPRQVATHPLRGSLFENAVVIEILKHEFNRGRQPNLTFFRDSRGLECDVLHRTGQGIGAIEIKSGETVTNDYFQSLDAVAALVPEVSFKAVVYAGQDRQSRSDCEVVPLSEVGGLLTRSEAIQRIEAFVKEKSGPPPQSGDLETLDKVFETQIVPLLEELQPMLEVLGEGLFDESQMITIFSRSGPGTQTFDRIGLVDWQQIKEEHLVQRGFKLSDQVPVKCSCNWRFWTYTGEATETFNVELSIEWTLGGDSFEREVRLGERAVYFDEGAIPSLNVIVDYTELGTSSVQANRTAVEVVEVVMGRIDELSRPTSESSESEERHSEAEERRSESEERQMMSRRLRRQHRRA